MSKQKTESADSRHVFEADVRVIEYFRSEGLDGGKPYANAIVRLDGRLVKFKIDLASVPSMEEFVDRDCLIKFTISPDFKTDYASPRIVGVE